RTLCPASPMHVADQWSAAAPNYWNRGQQDQRTKAAPRGGLRGFRRLACAASELADDALVDRHEDRADELAVRHERHDRPRVAAPDDGVVGEELPVEGARRIAGDDRGRELEVPHAHPRLDVVERE